MSFGVACAATYQCNTNVNLSCRSSVCSCPSVTGQVWYWSTNYMTCNMCPSGWIIQVGHCYYINYNSMNWQSARSYCQSQGGDLMIIRSQAEYAVVQSFYNTYIGSGGLYVCTDIFK